MQSSRRENNVKKLTVDEIKKIAKSAADYSMFLFMPIKKSYY
jgi:hypothetical protein